MKCSCAVNEVSATLAGMAPPALLGAKQLNRIARGRLEFGALGHLSFAEVIGAFYATGGLMPRIRHEPQMLWAEVVPSLGQ